MLRPRLATALKRGPPLASSRSINAPTVSLQLVDNSPRQQQDERPPPATSHPAAGAAAPVAKHRPVLDIAGGGMWFYWKAGVLSYLQQHHDLSSIQLHGASSGAIVAVLAACDVDLLQAARRTVAVMQAHGAHDRTFGVLGVWGGIVRRCLEELLPEDCHTRCTGRVRLRVTAWPSLQPIYIERFHSKAEVVDACLASGHLPFLLDGRLSASVKGMKAMDGAFSRWAAMLQQEPRALLSLALGSLLGGAAAPSALPLQPVTPAAGAGGAAQQLHAVEQPAGTAGHTAAVLSVRRFQLDYVFDDRLGPLRIRFAAVRLRSADGLQQLVQRGFEYGQRMHRQGVWAAWLGALPPHRAAT